MKRGKYIGTLIVLILVISMVVGCSSATPAPAQTTAPTATTKPASTATATATAGGTATAKPTATVAGKVYKLTDAGQGPLLAALNAVGNQAWFKWLEEQSGGRIQFIFIPNAQAASADRLYDAAKNGIVDVSDFSYAYSSGKYPIHDAIQGIPLAYGSPGSRQMLQTMLAMREKYPQMAAEHSDIVWLGYMGTNPANVNTVKKQVTKLEDVKGLILNASGAAASLVTRAIGATPEAIQPTELYDALSKGVCDGNLLNYSGMINFNYQEVTNYTFEIGLFLSGFVKAMSPATYNSLPADLQKLFTDKTNIERVTMIMGTAQDKYDDVCKARINQAYTNRGKPPIYTPPAAEADRWIATVMPVRDSVVKTLNGKGLPGQQIMDDILKISQQYAFKSYNADDEAFLKKYVPDSYTSFYGK